MSQQTENSLAGNFDQQFIGLETASAEFVPALVSLILSEARRHRASDVHLTPEQDSLLMYWRIDGVLHRIAAFNKSLSERLVSRLKVLAGLLTYRTDIPQEGRISREHHAGEVRIATFPVLSGERAVIRLFADYGQLQQIANLNMNDDTEQELRQQLQATSGVILICGPSGSGKTTTAYACLRELVSSCSLPRCVMSLEDPVEMVLAGVAQSQVKPAAGFGLATGIRSLMRQDPDVIMIGEIRDAETAEAAFQAALTGHLVVTTFHAGSAVEALSRLGEMGLDATLIRSVLRLVVCQRLLRRSCPCDGLPLQPSQGDLEENIRESSCPQCGGTGFSGRFLLTEHIELQQRDLAEAVLQRVDAIRFAEISQRAGFTDLASRARSAVLKGLTTGAEIFRILGRDGSALNPD
ncbi:MAG: GspE/PulE family protein [Planctomycetaceae bacterium]